MEVLSQKKRQRSLRKQYEKKEDDLSKANNLLWLGRYSERVYTTLRMFYQKFDKMIESTKDEYTDFCNKLNIPVIYTSNEDFVARYLYDKENPDSVYSNPYIQVRQKKSIQNLPRLVWRQFYGLCLFRGFCLMSQSQEKKM